MSSTKQCFTTNFYKLNAIVTRMKLLICTYKPQRGKYALTVKICTMHMRMCENENQKSESVIKSRCFNEVFKFLF